MSEEVKEHLKKILGADFLRLPVHKQDMVVELYNKGKKTDVIYVLWFLSLHYLYVKKWLFLILFLASLGGMICENSF